MQSEQQQRRSILHFWPLVAMMLVFCVPLGASFYAFYTGNTQILGSSMGNKGTLVQPMIDLSPNFDKAPPTQWHIANVEQGACSQSCERRVWEIRQARIALGADSKELTRWIITDNPTPLSGEFASAAGDLNIAANVDAVVTTLDGYLVKPGSVVLLDHQLKAVLIYAPDTETKKILKDLNRLIKGKRS